MFKKEGYQMKEDNDVIETNDGEFIDMMKKKEDENFKIWQSEFEISKNWFCDNQNLIIRIWIFQKLIVTIWNYYDVIIIIIIITSQK